MWKVLRAGRNWPDGGGGRFAVRRGNVLRPAGRDDSGYASRCADLRGHADDGQHGAHPWDEATDSIPAIVTVIMMPLTFSVADGIALGFISYVASATN